MSQSQNHYAQINALARQAFAHWGAGRLVEASAGFTAAITLVRDGGLPAVADLHAQLAGVLDVQGRLDAAVAQSELALAAEQAQGGADDASPSVKLARHFLADRLIRQGQPQRALEVVTPSLVALPDDWLLNLTQFFKTTAWVAPLSVRRAPIELNWSMFSRMTVPEAVERV